MSETRAVRAGEELPLDALNAWLREAAPAVGKVTSVEQFPGGFSNLTYLLRTSKGEVVLRRPPVGVGPGTAHDMPREARILSVLELRGIPAPKHIATCEDAAVIGAPFYLMERVRGEILRGSSAPASYTAATFTKLGETFLDTLVAIHGATPSDPVIGGLGKPMGYVQRQVEGWTARWVKSRTDEVPAVEELAQWLAANQPGESGACLVHNDFKFDNLVLDPAQPGRIVAVLDWEMATVGDPLLDVGTTLGYWVERDDPPAFKALGLGVTALPGNLTRAQLWERYLKRSGRAMRPSTFYEAFGAFKIAVIAQQIFARYRNGLTKDERFARLGDAVRLLGERGVAIVKTLLLMLTLATNAAQAQDPASPDSVVAAPAAEKWNIDFLPVLGSAPETGLQYGAAVFATKRHPVAGTRTSSVVSNAIRTAKGQTRAFVELDRWTANNDWRYSAIAIWQKFPLPFYGISDTTDESDVELYTPRGTELGVTVQRRIGRRQWLMAGLRRTEWEMLRTEAGGQLEPGIITGSLGGRTVVATIGAISDTRDKIFAPTRGQYAEFTLGFSDDGIGSEFSFLRARADARSYFSVGRGHVVAVQAVAQGVKNTPPFDQLSLIGSSSAMRGYVPGRFRDRFMASAQAEWRSPTRRNWGLAAFGGAGFVSSVPAEIFAGRVLPTLGVGVRYRMDPATGATIRVDYARGTPGQSGLYVVFSEAF